MILFIRQWLWKRRFAKEIRGIAPKISHGLALVYAEDWLLTINNAHTLSPEQCAQEEMGVWNFP